MTKSAKRPLSRLSRVPQSESSEKGLLASIFHAPGEVLDECKARNVTPDWFLDPTRGKIFDAFERMREQKRTLDLPCVTQFLEDENLLEEVGGCVALSELFTFVHTHVNFPSYLDILREKYVLKTASLEAMEVGTKIADCRSVQECFDLTTGAFKQTHELCAEAEKVINHKEDVMEFVDSIEKAFTGDKKIERFTTTIPTLDGLLGGGFTRGQLVVIHAPTSCGKSVLSHAVAKDNAVTHSKASSIYSFEMLKPECISRLISNQGEVSSHSISNARFTAGEFKRFMRASGEIGAAPLTIYDIKRCKASPSAIEGSIRAHKRKRPLDIVVIDYLGLIKFPNTKDQKRKDQELQSFSSTLKLLAQELDILIVLVTQANKDGSVFDASQVESDADIVLTIVPKIKIVNGQKKIIGSESLFVQKARGAERGKMIPILLQGEYSRLIENREEPEAAF